MLRRILVLALVLFVSLAHLHGAWATACSFESSDESVVHAIHEHGHGEKGMPALPEVVEAHASLQHHCDGVGCPGCASTLVAGAADASPEQLDFSVTVRKSVAELITLAPWRPPIG